MTDLHTRYDRRADVLYLFTDRNRPAIAKEDSMGIVWRYADNFELVGATIIDFHEIWSDRMAELAEALANQFHLPRQRAAKALEAADG